MLRPTGSGPLSALLVLAPLVALPILAVVGIPNFAGGNNVSDSQNVATGSGARNRNAVPESRLGAESSDADDLFAPIKKSRGGFDDPLRRTKKKSSAKKSRADDEFDADVDAFEENEDSLDTGSRSRGRPRSNSFETDDETDAEFNTSSRDSRSRLRNQSQDRDATDEEFTDDSEITLQGNDSDPADADGVKTADLSGDFSGTTRSRGNQFKRTQSNSDFEENSDVEPSRPATGSRGNAKSSGGSRPSASRTKPRNPDDAPIFDPGEDLEADANAAEFDQADPEPPAQKKPLKSQPMASVRDDTGTAAKSAAANGQEELTLKNLFERLQTVGMTADPDSRYFTYLEDSDSFLFTCTASRSGSNAAPQKFEAEANEPVLAVFKVLKKVQTWQATKTSKKAR